MVILALSVSVIALTACAFILFDRLKTATACRIRAEIQAECQIKSLFEQLGDALAEKAELMTTLASLQTLWIVGQYRFGDTGAIVWDFQGVFTTEEKAIAACKSATWFIARMELDKELPEATEVMPAVSWPLLKETT